MIFINLYDRYSKNWIKSRILRKKSFIAKYIFSLPYQILKNHYKKHILKVISEASEFPKLSEVGTNGIVVSLTSFPFRISTLHLVIRSILKQDMPPEKIVLWLSKDQFPNTFNDLSSELKELIPHGLDIFFMDEDIRSHKKYYYMFQQTRDKIIITIDDDYIYPPNTISRLYDLHRKFPKAICSNRVRTITFDRTGAFDNYRKWGRETPSTAEQAMRYVAIGYGGVLYPPNFYTNINLSKELFLELAPLADDLWLKANQIVNQIPVAVQGGLFCMPIEIPRSQHISLRSENDGKRKNDEQWDKLNKHFDLLKVLASYKSNPLM